MRWKQGFDEESQILPEEFSTMPQAGKQNGVLYLVPRDVNLQSAERQRCFSD